jgi:hypothetical protein
MPVNRSLPLIASMTKEKHASGSSSDLLPPPPPAEKATARQDQAENKSPSLHYARFRPARQ